LKTLLVFALVVVAGACQHGGTPLQVPANSPPDAGPLYCTQIACSDQLVVELRRAGKPTAFGITVMYEGQTVTCPPPGPLQARTCNEAISSTVPTDDGALQLVEIRGTPVVVDMEVRDGNLVVAQRRITPSYERRQPNGPRCPPVCRQATTTWRLP
jgi:hypothetical protein